MIPGIQDNKIRMQGQEPFKIRRPCIGSSEIDCMRGIWCQISSLEAEGGNDNYVVSPPKVIISSRARLLSTTMR
jgi:hypothetical protein